MKYNVKNLENSIVAEVELTPEIFGLPKRADILTRMVNWQLAKRRSGNHQTRGISMISGTTRKPWKQKGTGRARQGSLRSPQFRGGAVIFGPVVRDHSFSLQKKVRKLALKIALSSKFADGKLIIIDQLISVDGKTKTALTQLKNLDIKNALFIDGEQVDSQFAKAVKNIPYIDVLPQQGINVYDILHRDTLVLTRSALNNLEIRLK